MVYFSMLLKKFFLTFSMSSSLSKAKDWYKCYRTKHAFTGSNQSLEGESVYRQTDTSLGILQQPRQTSFNIDFRQSSRGTCLKCQQCSLEAWLSRKLPSQLQLMAGCPQGAPIRACPRYQVAHRLAEYWCKGGITKSRPALVST